MRARAVKAKLLEGGGEIDDLDEGNVVAVPASGAARCKSPDGKGRKQGEWKLWLRP